MRLALFDLDNTLLDGDSDIEWSVLLARHGAMDEARTRAYHVDYDAGTLDIDAFLQFQLEPLAREPMERLLGWREVWLRDFVRPRISRAARELVSRHANAGHELALISATNRFLVDPIAAELSIPNVVATEPESVNGRFSGRVAGVPCFRAGKIARLADWLASRGLGFADVRESWFYSDSHNDLPLLERVTHPVCVDPDAKLADVALARGWKTIRVRSSSAVRGS